MNEDLHDLAGAYAVDALDVEERRAFEAHLEECADCRAEVAELQEAAAELSVGLDQAPPEDLRARILAEVAADRPGPTTILPTPGLQGPGSVDPQRGNAAKTQGDGQAGRHRTMTRRGWLAAAAALLVAAGGWGASQLLGGESPADRIVQAQDALEHEARTPSGEVVVVTSEEEDAAVLQVPDEMTAPPEGQVYQAWFVGADGSARSAGLLSAEAFEAGETVLEGSPGDAVAVGITVEPPGGSDEPTSEPFVVVPLG